MKKRAAKVFLIVIGGPVILYYLSMFGRKYILEEPQDERFIAYVLGGVIGLILFFLALCALYGLYLLLRCTRNYIVEGEWKI